MRRLIWIFLFLLAVIRIVLYFRSLPHHPDGTRLRISNRLASEPIKYENSQRLSLSGFKFYLPLYIQIDYGDKLIVEGVVKGNKLLNVKLIKVITGDSFLFNFRNKLLDYYKKNLPYPHSSLISGVVIGAKSDIGNDFWDKLKKSGTAHVVVASGMNVTLVAGFLITFLTLFLARPIALPIVFIGVWFYAVLSGFDAPIIRASIMGSLTFLAQMLGRLKLSLRVLNITALIMLIIWPFWIVDLGFWLSFMATLSIIMFEPKFRKIFRIFPKFLRTDFSTTVSAQIGVAPILFYYFGQFNLLSPFVNMATLWTIPYITVIGIIGGILGLVYQPLGKIILLISYPLTSWFIFIVRMFGK